MNSAGIIIYPGTIRFERALPGSPSRIWEYLTVPARLAEWLAEAQLDLRTGGQIELEFDAERAPERKKDGTLIRGVISRCGPPRILSYSWAEDSAVNFELKTETGDVQLVLTHSGIAEPLVHKRCAGWHAHLDILPARLSGEKTPEFLPLFEKLSKHYKQNLKQPVNKERRGSVTETGARKDRRRTPRGSDFV